jgi:hypothetical protein
MAETDLDQLEMRVEQLIENYQRACMENRRLKEQQSDSERLNAELRRRLAKVIERIEALEQE